MSLRNGPISDYESVTPWTPAPSADGDGEQRGAEWPPRSAAARLKDADTDSTRARTESRAWLLKRGHALSYAGLFLFTFILYFRPYEYVSFLSAFTSMAFWVALATLLAFFPTQLALEGNLTARTREVNLALLLLLAALLSMPLAISPGEAWKTFTELYVKVILMFVVLVNVLRTERRLKWMIFLGLAVGMLLSVGAISDFRFGRVSEQSQRVVGVISRGMFGNPNDLALHLITMIPLALALMFSARGPHKKLVYGACAALLAAGTVVTFSRGGFLGLLAASLVTAWKIGRRNRFAIVVLVLLAGVAFLAFMPNAYGDRLAAIVDSSRDATGSSHARKELLLLSIVFALRNPLFGIGMDNFHIVSIGEAVSHNAYTQVASELGFPALIIYVLFMLTPLKHLRRIERETFETRRGSRFYYLAGGLQASIIGYMVSSFFASVAYQWYVYYLVGYAVVLRRIYEARARAEGEAKEAEARAAETEAEAEQAISQRSFEG